MLGRLLELALVTADTGAAWLRYQSLGFAPAESGDVWSHPYGVVACRELAIGLHARGDEPLSLVFVRPDVAGLHRALQARGIRVEQAKLGSDVFNELTLREPGGVALRVIEARTFSPPAAIPARTALGRLASLSLPVRDLEAATAFWQALDMPVREPVGAWEGSPVGELPLACHARRVLAEPALVFESSPSPDDPALGQGDLQRERPLALEADHARLRTAEDLSLILFP